MDRPQKFSQLRSAMRKLPGPIVSGKVTTVGGLGLVASGLGESAKIGDRACVAGRIPAEVVATSPEGVRLLPFGTWDGIGRGDNVDLRAGAADIFPGPEWVGRVVDAFGDPLDGIDRGVVMGIKAGNRLYGRTSANVFSIDLPKTKEEKPKRGTGE